MPAFKTNDGKEWVVTIDAPKIRDVRAELNIDLGALDFGPVAQQLGNDPVKLVETLWILCRAQATINNVTADQFGQSLTGDSIDHASDALIRARADFSPTRMRSLILKQKEMSDRIREKTASMASERLGDPTVEARILKAAEAKIMAEMEEALTRLESASNSPPSSELSPTA